jgi:hypothetical protein
LWEVVLPLVCAEAQGRKFLPRNDASANAWDTDEQKRRKKRERKSPGPDAGVEIRNLPR